MQAPSRDDTQVKVRLNPETHNELKVRAAQNRRTLMREIEFRVIESLKRDQAQGASA